MKSKLFTFTFIFASLLFGCKENNSPTELETKNNLVSRSWKGDKFFTSQSSDTLRVVKEMVLLMDFKSDGRFQLIYAIDSGPGRWGNWNLEENSKAIRLSSDSLHSGIFSIVELNSSRFTFGDTNSIGYSLIPIVK